MTIYLARHGQTTGDIENRYGGDYDDHLTELGQQQSRQLAEQLAAKGIVRLFASPLIRAGETAAIVGERLGCEVGILAGFKERNNYGVLTGMTKPEAMTKHPDQVELLKNPRNTLSGAEGYEIFRERITRSLAQLPEVADGNIAVVTHGGPLRLIFREILQQGEIEVGDCAFVAFERCDDTYRVLESNGIQPQRA